jgi:hypothetical protein
MNLIDNLNAIDKCKQDIKTALKNKGVEMEGVVFAEYAEKIDALQLESGDTPTPTPSAEYIYSNGYLTGGDKKNDIINFVPYEIVLDDNGQFIIELTSPTELFGLINDLGEYVYPDVIFTFDIPTSYSIVSFEGYDPINNGGQYVSRPYKLNPRFNEGRVYRNDVEYISYVRKTSDGEDYYSADVQASHLKYRITIKKN